jgi:valyl-tRNA synthetase
LAGVEDSDLSTQVSAVTSLAWLSAPGAEFRPSASLEVRLSGGTVVVELDTSGTIDVAAERRRLEKDLAAAQKELASTAAKLDNADFLAKAPEQVVTKIRDRQRLAQEETDRINARLAGLQ